MSRLDRITSDPSICHGKPTVRGLRYPVENLLELLASGMTVDEVLEDHPNLERGDLLAVLESESPPTLAGTMTRLTIEVPDDVAARLVADAAERGVPPETLAGQVVAEQFPTRRRRLAFGGIGSSTSGGRAAEADEMLAEGFGRD